MTNRQNLNALRTSAALIAQTSLNDPDFTASITQSQLTITASHALLEKLRRPARHRNSVTGLIDPVLMMLPSSSVLT